MLNMIKGSLQIELDRFFGLQSDSNLPCQEVTTAAFSMARKKFSHGAFVEVQQVLNKTFYQTPIVKKWHHHRLLAVDGSTLTLEGTPEFISYFGKVNEQAVKSTVRISQLYDILNKQTVDFQYSPYAIGERELATRHLASSEEENDLILYDRGYAASWLFALHTQNKVDFCARMKCDFSAQVSDFFNSKSKDRIITMEHTGSSRRECVERGIPLDGVKVRLVKLRLPTGETEILATSLFDSKKYPVKGFLNLYHQRWFVEEDYKIMKSRMEFENFTGKSPESVLQDIYAKIVTKNFAAIVLLETELWTNAQRSEKAKPRQINFTYVLNKLKDSIVRIITIGCQVSKILNTIIKHCAKSNYIKRENRKNPRKLNKINKLKFNIPYKRTT